MGIKIEVKDEVRAESNFNPLVISMIEQFYEAAQSKDASRLSGIVCDPLDFDLLAGVDAEDWPKFEEETEFVDACHRFASHSEPLEAVGYEDNESGLIVVTVNLRPGSQYSDDIHYGHYEWLFWSVEGALILDGIRAMNSEYMSRYEDDAFIGFDAPILDCQASKMHYNELKAGVGLDIRKLIDPKLLPLN